MQAKASLFLGIAALIFLRTTAPAAEREALAQLFGGEAALKAEAKKDPVAASIYLLTTVFSDPLSRDPLIPDIARALASAGKHDLAVKLVQTMAIRNLKIASLRWIAEDYLKAGRQDRARETVEEALGLLGLGKHRRERVPDPIEDRNIVDLIPLLVSLGELSTALEAAQALVAPQDKIVALARIGAAYLKSAASPSQEHVKILRAILSETGPPQLRRP